MSVYDFLVEKAKKLLNKSDMARLAQKKPIEGVKEFVDIPYAEGGNKLNLLDVYRPENAEGALPVIIDVHGGAWVYGDKEINKYFCLGLAKSGYVVVNISYRLLPEGQFPKMLNDVLQAIDWTVRNVLNYGGDLNNLYIVGDSAGGHNVALALMALYDEKFREDIQCKVKADFRAAGLICAVTDLEVFKNKKGIFRYLFRQYLGDDYKTNPHLKNLTIRNGDMSKLPPLFMVSADGDFIHKQTERFAEECEKRGVTYKLKYFKKGESENKLEHVFNVLYPEYPESVAATTEMLDFFEQYKNEQ